MTHALTAINLPARSESAGPTPKLEWLPLELLVVDHDYQREISNRGKWNIQRIAAEFSWAKFSPVTVAAVAGGKFAIIDGQHRATAALSLGFESVPCCIVKATPEEAAAIFTAVNGNVTPMTIQQVFKAGLKSGTPWALGIDAAATAAGAAIARYPIPLNKLESYTTNAIGACRAVWESKGAAFLTDVFLCLKAARDGASPGIINAKRVKSMAFLLDMHPGWRRGLKATCQALGQFELMVHDIDSIGLHLEKRLGAGRADPDDWRQIVAKVQAQLDRNLRPQMISGVLRLPYAQVEKAVAEIRQAQEASDA